ncbi:MAG: flagellar protein FlgN [Ignavibacteria bacterium]|nr:flagellar protein FlgN [Ignavibacteria bacterium]
MRNLSEIINKEYEILKDMLKVAEEQKVALIRYDINTVERTAIKLSEMSRDLKNFETERLNFLVNNLKLTRKQAYTIKLSELANIIEIPNETLEKKEEMREIIERLASINSLNKLLSNRALSCINDILSSLSNSSSSVCNVRI